MKRFFPRSNLIFLRSNLGTSRSGLSASPWLIVGGSLAAMAGLVLLLWRPAPGRGQRGELVLYCAAGLHQPVKEISAEYQKQYGGTIKIEPGGSGTLLSKLRVAPGSADLFLAAEDSYIREARAQGLVAETLPVARQHVVIGVQPGNPRAIAAPADLLRPEVRVVVPNPELAAVGRAVKRALAGSGQWDALVEQTRQSDAKVSLVGTVNEAAQAVKLGAADAAIVWDSTAGIFGIDFVEVPAWKQGTVEQVTLGVVAAGERPTQALHFARYLSARDRGQLVFQKHHLQPLEDADIWEDRPELVLMSGAMLKPAVDELVKQFSQREGVDINTIYAGCGIHVAQMKAMKRGEVLPTHFPDAYFSCDVSFMQKVEQWFEAAKRISRNDIVLAVAKGNPKQVRSIDDLARPELRVGLTHPVNSALGALTDELLKKLGLHARVYAAGRKHPVLHADAAHLLVNQLRTGALDLVVVYRSNVLSSPENLKHLEIVEMNLPQAIAIQPYAVAKDSEHKYLMRRLLEAILAPESQKRFRDAGFHWIAEGDSR